MNFLRQLFEKQLDFARSKRGTIQEDEDGNIHIGETPFSAVDVLSGDGQAFIQEFDAWKDRWSSIAEKNLKVILGLPGNRKRFTDLCNALRNGQLIPLVGSGMSIPTGLPAWTEFLREIRKRSSMTENELEELLSRSAYEEAAARLAATMPERLFDERIEHDLRIDEPDTISGAVMFLPEVFGKLVLTTNLDDILEILYQQRASSFTRILVGRGIADYRRVKASSERLLLKIHGDCRSRDGRVLGKSDYEKAYCDGSPVKEELVAIYRNHNILCLGCSLGPDRTVALLAEVAKLDKAMPKHFAFLRHPGDPAALLKREHFLTERDIFPIWYSGDHDQSIETLVVGMLKSLGKL